LTLQKTLVLFKPDCLLRGLIGRILQRFEDRGLIIVGFKMLQLSDEILREHYAHLADKPFFPGVLKAMQRTPVVAVALAGVEAVTVAREMAGATNSREALPGTIRGDFGASIQNNLVHISDSAESAKSELERFFSSEELFESPAEQLGIIYSSDEID
jgi:nucleoside-diphosphate kinase